jgi:hypothetical protein
MHVVNEYTYILFRMEAGAAAELWARSAIADLVARYNANGDAGRFDQVIALFALDAVMDVGDGCTYAGTDEIRRIFTGTRDRVLDPAGGPGFVRHFTATHQIDLHDETTASGRCYFQVLTAHGLDHWGRYLDRYRVVDGTWRFASRRVIIDGHDPRSTLVGMTETKA